MTIFLENDPTRSRCLNALNKDEIYYDDLSRMILLGVDVYMPSTKMRCYMM
jgi:hypothetical protein